MQTAVITHSAAATENTAEIQRLLIFENVTWSRAGHVQPCQTQINIRQASGFIDLGNMAVFMT